ncbi:predicted protein [Sclerotinia sclerotiorum 1980 UF-70]|uniref:Uncharacterized protein n=1 Tax=Sclerotinia sclerotiorum (strain ATCC 18683 / 1980 / Ss-1) TaxID=665079 RepID=A7E5E9_SCLS1|nr:predicted protein [Sclerotinia sclerotiorum 1980 UF-70]EDN91121.1 predicted protein [Sclerotinia sclerotiorum 1980 UF-70]
MPVRSEGDVAPLIALVHLIEGTQHNIGAPAVVTKFANVTKIFFLVLR